MKNIACIFLTLATLLTAFDLQVEVEKKCSLKDTLNTAVSSLNHCAFVYMEPIPVKSDSPKHSVKVKFNPLSVSLPFQKFTPAHFELVKLACFLQSLLSYPSTTTAISLVTCKGSPMPALERTVLFCIYRV